MIIVRSILSITGTPSNGTLPIGNGQGFTINTLTAGTNITITNAPGTITIDAAGGSGAPAGSTNEIQFNNAAAFAASADLRWIIADDRLVLGTENTADINSRMVIIGKGISTQNTFVVHNSTGTNNSLVVRDNGFIGFGALPFTTQKYRFNIGTNANLAFTNPSGTISRITAVNDVGITGNQLSLNGFPLIFEAGAVEYGRFDGSEFRILSDVNCNKSMSSGTEANLLNLNNTSLNTNITIALNFRSNTTTQFASIKANNGTGAGTINYMSFWIRNLANTNVELARLNGNGNLLLGTVTDVASSILTIESTTKGVLLPRLTTTEINNIVSPATGLTVYNTTVNTLCFYNGSSWQKCSHSNL